MLDRIARGEIKAIETTPQTRCRIDRSFKTEDGWTFEIFDDCGQMDYLNWAQTPQGERCADWVRKGFRWDDPMMHMKEADTKLAAALRWDGHGDYIPYYPQVEPEPPKSQVPIS